MKEPQHVYDKHGKEDIHYIVEATDTVVWAKIVKSIYCSPTNHGFDIVEKYFRQWTYDIGRGGEYKIRSIEFLGKAL